MQRETIDHMLHYEQTFGNVFERRESEYCAVLMKYLRKVKGEQRKVKLKVSKCHCPNGSATKNQKY